MLLGPFRHVQDERGRQSKDQRGELVQVQTAGLVMSVVPDVTSTCMERKRSRARGGQATTGEMARHLQVLHELQSRDVLRVF